MLDERQAYPHNSQVHKGFVIVCVIVLLFSPLCICNQLFYGLTQLLVSLNDDYFCINKDLVVGSKCQRPSAEINEKHLEN